MKKLCFSLSSLFGFIFVLGVNPVLSAEGAAKKAIDFSRDHDKFIKDDPKYANSTKGCPSSSSLRKALEGITTFPPDEITIDGKVWLTKNGNIYNKELTAQDIAKLPLIYDVFTSKEGKITCKVQFHQKPGGRNDASMHIVEK